MTDLIFISMENWDDIWRRNQFVCAEFARRHPENKILFVGLARDVSNRLRRGMLSDLNHPATYTVPGFPNITITHPLKFLPNSFMLTRRLNEWMFRRHIRRAARSLGMNHPVLWLNPHSANHTVGRMNESAVLYDITDDWTSLTQSPELTRLVQFQDEDLCRRANRVIVCSQHLYDLKSKLLGPADSSRLHLVPNGVDANHYRRVLDDTGPLPPETSHWQRPVYGYTGTIHPDRVDVSLIEAMARSTQGSVVLVGPNHLSEAIQTKIASLGNVHMPGPVPYARVPDIMRAFDVCVAPHHVTPFTESLNPIKLWEYLAAGKPIVSTDIAGFRSYPEFVAIGKTHDEFLRMMKAALVESPDLRERRRQEALAHSWESRVSSIEIVIHAAISARKQPAANGASAVAPCQPALGVPRD
jgi:teichuronic acid biosynthesis glycosyltransferase TuaH